MYNQKDITLLTVNWNQQPCVELLLKSYVKHHYKSKPLKLMLVDNGSNDGSKEWLRKNEIPFFDFAENIGHENAVSALYEEIKTKYALLTDTDVEFKDNVHHYMDAIKGTCISVGEMIDKNFINSTKIKDRISPWFFMWAHDKAIALGINTFRDPACEDWTYDVGSWFTEKLLSNSGFKNFNLDRLPGNQDEDIVSMMYMRFDHIGKVSWDVFEKHQDRVDEVLRRRSYIQQRLKEYENVSLKGKFIYA